MEGINYKNIGEKPGGWMLNPSCEGTGICEGTTHGAFGSNFPAILCIHECYTRILWLLWVTILSERCGQTGKDGKGMRKMKGQKITRRGESFKKLCYEKRKARGTA